MSTYIYRNDVKIMLTLHSIGFSDDLRMQSKLFFLKEKTFRQTNLFFGAYHTVSTFV